MNDGKALDRSLKEAFGFLVPAERHRVEETILKSRFITTLQRAKSAAAARQFVAEMRAEFPDATHHCWAFLAGPPGTSASVGMSDDGEPHGTAGRPMLQVLSHGRVGEVGAVVTRYYGGTKLGTGGLARAYSGGVALALESLSVVEKVEMIGVEIEIPYTAVDEFERNHAAYGVKIQERVYGDQIRYVCQMAARNRGGLEVMLRETTRGAGSLSLKSSRPS